MYKLAHPATYCCGSIIIFELILYRHVQYSQISIPTDNDKNDLPDRKTHGIENRTSRQNLNVIGRELQRIEIKHKST